MNIGENEFLLIRKVMKIGASDTPEFSEFLETYKSDIPFVDFSENPKPSKESFIEHYHLGVEERVLVIKKMSEKMLSDKNFSPEFYGIVILQSFCAIILCDINSVNDETVSTYLNLFDLAIKVCTKYNNIFYQVFLIYLNYFFDETGENIKDDFIQHIEKIIGSFSSQLSDNQEIILRALNLLLKKVDAFDEKFFQVARFIDTIESIIKWNAIEEKNEIAQSLLKLLDMIPVEKDDLKYVFSLFSCLSQVSGDNTASLQKMQTTILRYINKFPYYDEKMPTPFSKTFGIQTNPVEMLDYHLFEEQATLSFYEGNIVMPETQEMFSHDSVVRIVVDFFHRFLRIYGPVLFDFLFNLMLSGEMKDSIDAYAIVYLFILEDTRYILEMRDYINTNNIFTKLFSKTIFLNDISIFSDPENKIIKLRLLAFAVFGKMITHGFFNDYFSHIISFLQYNIQNIAVFTESICFIISSLPKIFTFETDLFSALSTLFSDELTIQQQAHLRGEENVEQIRKVFGSAIIQISSFSSFFKLSYISPLFLESMLSLYFEENFETLPFNAFFTVTDFYYSQDIKAFKFFLSTVNKFLLIIEGNIENPKISRPFINIMNLLIKMQSLDLSKVQGAFVESKILTRIRKVLIKCENHKDARSMFLQAFLFFKRLVLTKCISEKDIKWAAMIKTLQTVKPNEEIVSELEYIVTNGESSFSSIENTEVLKLLVLSLKDSPLLTGVIEKLCEMCRSSVWNCFACFKSEILDFLLKLINTVNNDALFGAIIYLFSVINLHVSSRQLFFTFSKLFLPIDNKHVRPNIEALINSLKLCLVKANHSPPAFIHFSSDEEYLEFSGLSAKYFADSVVFTIWLLLDECKENGSGFPVLSLIGETISLRCFIADSSFVIHFEKEGKKTVQKIPLNIPLLTWFNITLHFNKSLTSAVLCINGAEVGNCTLPGGVDDFKVIIKEPQSKNGLNWNKHGQLSHFAVFTGVHHQFLDKMMYKIGVDGGSLILNQPGLVALFSPHRCRKNVIFNLVHNSTISNALLKGTVCSFVASFMQVFESSNGIGFIISLWSQIILKNEEGKVNSKLPSLLSSLMLRLLQVSETAQSQLLLLDAYSVILNFISQLPKEELTLSLWKNFLSQYHTIKQQDLKESISYNIIFNGELCLLFDQQVTEAIIQQWLVLLQNDPFSHKILKISDIVSMILSIIKSDTSLSYKNSVIFSAAGLFSFLARDGLSVHDAESILSLCILTADYGISFPILQFFSVFFEENDPTPYVPMILFIGPLLFVKGDDSSRSELIHIMSMVNNSTSKTDMFLFKFVFSVLKELSRNPSESTSAFLLASICGLVCDSTVTSFEQLMMMSPAITSSSYLFISAIAAIGANDEARTEYRTFLNFVLTESGIKKIQEEISYVGLVSFAYYALFFDHKSLEFISPLIATSPKLTSLFLSIADVFEHNFKVDLSDQIAKVVDNILTLLIINRNTKTFNTSLGIFIKHSLFRIKKETTIFDENKEEEKVAPSNIFAIAKRASKMKEPHYEIGVDINDKGEWKKYEQGKILLNNLLRASGNSPFSSCSESISVLVYFLMMSKRAQEENCNALLRIYEKYKNVSLSPLVIDFKREIPPNLRAFFNESRKEMTPSISCYNEIISLITDVAKNPFNQGTESFAAVCAFLDLFILPEYLPTSTACNDFATESCITNSHKAWKKLMQKMAHEKSPFFEGANSKTRYMRACRFDYRFRPILMKPIPSDYENKVAVPLEKQVSKRSAEEEIKAIWSDECIQSKITGMKKGYFYVLPDSFVFVRYDFKKITIQADTVEYIFWRWNLQIPNSIEIFTTERRAFFFIFPKQQSHKFISNLMKIKLPNHIFIQQKPGQQEFQQPKVVELWQSNKLSTFNYIMILNMLSGRSFNNASCYPIFPWVIFDNEQEKLDLFNPEVFRDFSVPIGCFNKSALSTYKSKLLVPELGQNFLFSSGYSNPSIVNQYLVRIEPFTSMHVHMNDGHFDQKTRLFFSVSNSLDRIKEATSTYRELIPEFFYDPSFLVSSSSLSDSAKEVLDDVALPKWANNSAISFVNINAKALESQYVSEHINEWIDLIWGYKQKGEEAVKADNTYDPNMYQGYENENVEQRDNIRKYVGQIPAQLFTAKHPQREMFIPKPVPLESFSGITTHDSPPLKICAVGNQSETMKIISLHVDGVLFLSKLSGEKKELWTCTNISTGSRFIGLNDNGTFFISPSDSSGIIAYSSATSSIISLSARPHIAAVNCISSDNHFFVTGGRDASIALWKITDKNISVVSTSVVHNDTISAVFVSEQFGVVVGVSRDGMMTTFMLPDLRYIRSKDMELPPEYKAKSVVVTQCEGNIVISAEKESDDTQSTLFKTFTINGELISTNEFNFTTSSIVSVSTNTCFDRLLVLTDQNTVTLFDIHPLRAIRVVYRQESPIATFFFHKQTGNIIASDYHGCIFVIPFSPN